MLRSLVAVLLLATPVLAQDSFTCGTSDAVIQRDEALARWTAAKRAELSGKGIAPLTESRNGIVLMRADDLTAPFRRPIDVNGKSILFSRKDAQSFVATIGPLVYDEDKGNTGAPGVRNFTKLAEFPFFGQSVHSIYLGADGAIYLAPAPPASSLLQYSDLDLIALRRAAIAPMATTDPSNGASPLLWYKETSDAATITWKSSYEFQAVLYRNGDIRFNYKNVAPLRTGGIVITSGQEPWRASSTQLMSVDDPTSDTHNATGGLASMLDIVSTSVTRIDDSNLLEFRIKFAQPIDRTLLPSSGAILDIELGDFTQGTGQDLAVQLGSTDYFYVPGWGQLGGSTAWHIDGDTLVMPVLQDWIAGPKDALSVRALTILGSTVVDEAHGTVRLEIPHHNIHTDFSALTTGAEVTQVAEAFTLSPISVNAVWDQLRTAYGIKQEDWDGVAIYQNFYTDLILYAGAYSTGGNPQANGISTSTAVSTTRPRVPALMHMNTVEYGPNKTNELASHVVLHEFGHHWLLFIRIRENGQNTRALNPISAHPAQYIHTPAAFQVYDADDSSVMGGTTFKENGDGTYTTPSFYTASGYSWLDLYLMGLATPSEVVPFYYLTGTSLGGAYYPPQGQTYHGTKVPVTIQQVLDAMGPRQPAYPDTQNRFKVLFVLLTNPEREPTEQEIADVNTYRSLMERDFKIATGGRAEVSTEFAVPSIVRRRSARH